MKHLLLYCLQGLVAFWNVENYFDPFADTLAGGTDFTPQGEKHWTWRRFKAKRNALAKVIIALDVPDIVGLAEIENRFVLSHLVTQTPLAALDYETLHRDSPDKRGIDVAALYRRSALHGVSAKFLRLKGRATREILYLKAYWVTLGDTIHIFFNHWPSKRGGSEKSMPARREAAAVLRMALDSLAAAVSDAKVLIMGDFNDTPSSPLLRDFVYGSGEGRPLLRLQNAAEEWERKGLGTLKFQHRWECVDQVLYTPAMDAHIADCRIVTLAMLLEPDSGGTGYRPRACYRGPRYLAGISDHLPVTVRIRCHHLLQILQNPH